MNIGIRGARRQQEQYLSSSLFRDKKEGEALESALNNGREFAYCTFPFPGRRKRDKKTFSRFLAKCAKLRRRRDFGKAARISKLKSAFTACCMKRGESERKPCPHCYEYAKREGATAGNLLLVRAYKGVPPPNAVVVCSRKRK